MESMVVGVVLVPYWCYVEDARHLVVNDLPKMSLPKMLLTTKL